jgi:hypothetical protein
VTWYFDVTFAICRLLPYYSKDSFLVSAPRYAWAMRVPLSRIAHTRSGDKGDTCNIGVIAYEDRYYPVLLREVTAERVKRHFGDLVKGPVERFELPNLGALNFLLHQALGGGGTVSLRTDAQGKTFGAALLGLEIDLPPEL